MPEIKGGTTEFNSKQAEFLIICSGFVEYPPDALPTIDQNQKTFDSHLLSTIKEIKEFGERDPQLQILIIIRGQPSAGKDFVDTHIIEPAFREYLDVTSVGKHRFDQKAQDLREKPGDPVLLQLGNPVTQDAINSLNKHIGKLRVNTPRGTPLENIELYFTRMKLIHDTAQSIIGGERVTIAQGPAGTGLMYGVSQLEFEATREYIDVFSYELLTHLSIVAPEKLKHLYVMEIDIVRSPGMDIRALGRQAYKDSGDNLAKANFVAFTLGDSPIRDLTELRLRQVGGTIEQVEYAQTTSWPLVQYATNNFGQHIGIVPPDYELRLIRPIADDIQMLEFLLSINNVKSYRLRVVNNLVLSYIYMYNHNKLHQLVTHQPLTVNYSTLLNRPPTPNLNEHNLKRMFSLLEEVIKDHGLDYNRLYTLPGNIPLSPHSLRPDRF